jgi:hypothetical protein
MSENEDNKNSKIFHIQIFAIVTFIVLLYCAQGWVWWKLGQANGIRAGRAEMIMWRGYRE